MTIVAGLVALLAFAEGADASAETLFPPELVSFSPYPGNPLFEGAGAGHWDVKIRERGWILHEADGYHLWYTGYDGDKRGVKRLGYATSKDGYAWKRGELHPLVKDAWIEDMMVVRDGDVYWMFAEGENDVAQCWRSTDKIHWSHEGRLDVRLANGQPIPPGPYGTPTVWLEDGKWHLFYERRDLGVWLAVSNDRKVWTNVQDEPVLACGPETYDKFAIAVNQIVKRGDRYYAYYHGSGSATRAFWSTNVAMSTDLLHWTKYPKNPILRDNQSSAILVPVGAGHRLYVMHDVIRAYEPQGADSKTP